MPHPKASIHTGSLIGGARPFPSTEPVFLLRDGLELTAAPRPLPATPSWTSSDVLGGAAGTQLITQGSGSQDPPVLTEWPERQEAPIGRPPARGGQGLVYMGSLS